MKLLQRSITVACLFAVAASTAPTAAAQRGGDVFRQGQPLPDLELPTIDGTRTIRLSELRGERVLLIQFASW